MLVLPGAVLACNDVVDEPAGFAPNGARSDAGTIVAPKSECPDVARTVFASPTCAASGCHAAQDPAQGLDLASPNLTARLVGVRGRAGAFLVDPTAPEQSLLYTKTTVSAAPPRMPSGAPPLDDGTVACVLAWVTQVASESGITTTPAITPVDGGAPPILVPDASDAGATTIRVAAGATAPYTDPAGHVWAADTGFVGGAGSERTPPEPIAGTNASPLYNHERYGGTDTVPAPFHYTFTVPSGNYGVTLKFADTLFDIPGQRAFDVTINGDKVLTDFDIVGAAGAGETAVDRKFTTAVGADHSLTIDFTPGAVFNPMVCALAIEPAP
jgi:hypothetical protein